MGDLSANFSNSEFACQCCGVVKVSDELVDSLQDLRDLTGRPISVTSGYRCRAHNAEVGGSPRSQHLVGKAADIVIKGLSVRSMYDHAMVVASFRYGGVGVYPSQRFVHVDVRNEVARWESRRNGIYDPFPF